MRGFVAHQYTIATHSSSLSVGPAIQKTKRKKESCATGHLSIYLLYVSTTELFAVQRRRRRREGETKKKKVNEIAGIAGKRVPRCHLINLAEKKSIRFSGESKVSQKQEEKKKLVVG